MGEKTRPPVTGVQSATRILSLLRIVGAHRGDGIRLRELTELSGLDRSTAHRMLACLVDEGFVERIDSTKLYRLGLEALQWGFTSNGLATVVDRLRPLMQRLGRQTGDTVYLLVRSGDFALCLHREEGSYPIKAFMMDKGMRRPLGISAGGVAILALMPEEDVPQVYARNAREYERMGVSPAQFKRLVARTRTAGFSEMAHVSGEEARGVGCAFWLTQSSLAAISIAAINSRMLPQRMAELGVQLARELEPLAWKPRGEAGAVR
ncbi:MAG: IclR family transcriptional regulator [Pseudomonadota bacterium]